MTTHIIFWFGICWISYLFLGYPLLLWILGRMRSFHPVRRDGYYPSVSVLISARNEEKDIVWKVNETLHYDYPKQKLEVFVASDASEDGTNELLAQITDPRFHFLCLTKRGGKQAALNQLAQRATGEILFFTDANTHIEPTALKRMMAYYADVRVGCVTGVESNCEQHEQALSTLGSSYLDYESWINALESQLGSVLVCDGSMFSLRRSLFTPLQPEIANDLESPLRAAAAGYAILFDPTLRSSERATTSIWQEFGRRRRICAQGVLGMWRLRGCLHGLRGWQFVSRKLLRWLVLIPCLGTMLAALGIYAAPHFLAILSAAVIMFALSGVAASGRSIVARAIALPFCFVLLTTAALFGLMDTCCGRRYGVWDQPTLSRGA